MKPSALIFTDQESILESSRQALQDSWDLQPATSESEARAELESSQYKLILIDKQKVSTNESEFLTVAGQLSPTTPRVQFTKLAPTGELELHFSHPRVVSDETQAAAQPESFEEQIEHEVLRQTLFSKVGLSVSGGGFRDVFRRLRIGSKISWFSSLRNRIPLDVSS